MLAWLAADAQGRRAPAPSSRARGPTVRGRSREQWLDGVEQGRIGRRRGRGKAVLGHDDRGRCAARWRYHAAARVSARRIADEITEIDWQAVDRQARPRAAWPARRSRSTSRSRRTSTPGRRRRRAGSSRATRCGSSSCHPTTRSRASASPWRPRPRRCSPRSNPRTVSPTRSRSTPACAAPRSTGCEWDDVLDGDAIATRLLVRRSKSEAGTQRRPPIADNLRVVLADAWERQGRPREGKVVDRSVMSGKIAAPRREGAGTPPA